MSVTLQRALRAVVVMVLAAGTVFFGPGALAAPAHGLQCPPVKQDRSAFTRPVAHPHGLLWRISSPGTAPSWLFGTIHISNPQVLALAAPVVKALDHADRFVMEVVIDGQGVRAFARRMYFPDGGRLKPLVGDALFDRTMALLARYGLPPEAVARLRPWGAFITLSEPSAERGMPLDLVLMRKARARGERVSGLESAAEQADVFADMSTADQVALLRDTVCNFDLLQQQIARLEQLYLKRDLAGLQRLSESYQTGSERLTREVMDKLIIRRNQRMARRMLPYLRAGNAFIAIGALHLPGDRGVLSLLERQGYTVTPVY